MSLSPAEIQALTPSELELILQMPVVEPPAGQLPNLINPADWHTVVTLELTLVYSIPTIAVAIRCYTKRFITRRWSSEDYVLILAWMLAMAEIVTAHITYLHGHGVHTWNLPLKILKKQLLWTHIFIIIYDPCIFSVKLSILLFYLRTFVPERKGNRAIYYGIHTFIWANFMCYFIHFWFAIFICSPREKVWNPLYVGGHCYNQIKSITVLGIFNAISDFAVLFLPIASVMKLQLPLRKKLGIYAIFATGLLGCLTSIARTIYTFKIYHSTDVSWNMTAVGCWSVAEISIGLICASLPSFPTFFKHVKQNVDTTLSHSASGSGSGSGGRPSKFTLASMVRRKGGRPKNPWYDDSYLRTWQTLEGGPNSGLGMGKGDGDVRLGEVVVGGKGRMVTVLSSKTTVSADEVV